MSESDSVFKKLVRVLDRMTEKELRLTSDIIIALKMFGPSPFEELLKSLWDEFEKKSKEPALDSGETERKKGEFRVTIPACCSENDITMFDLPGLDPATIDPDFIKWNLHLQYSPPTSEVNVVVRFVSEKKANLAQTVCEFEGVRALTQAQIVALEPILRKIPALASAPLWFALADIEHCIKMTVINPLKGEKRLVVRKINNPENAKVYMFGAAIVDSDEE